jgi:hypothetical protein
MGVSLSGSYGARGRQLNAVSDVEIARVPALAVEQEADKSSVAPGERVTYQATVTTRAMSR